jgi:2-methylcitrate dehydratase PrpD
MIRPIDPHAPGLSRALAAALARLGPDDIPREIVRTVRLFVLDTLGVIGGAAKAPGIAELNGALRAWSGDGRATALLGGFHTSPPDAALANGAAAHALDFDDQHDPARVHVFCTALPAALAAAEARGGVTGRELVTALAVGVELCCRLGLACYNSLGKGWHPSTLFGTLAAAAAAAKILGLDETGMLNALAIASHQAGGSAQSMHDGALTKRLGPGFAARTGVLAAHLAANGLNGPARFLEGEAGIFRLQERGEAKPELLVDGLGTHWRTAELSMKPFPCCRCSHSTIQLGQALRDEGICAEDIEDGEIALGKVNVQIVGTPFDPPEGSPVVHAQFNVAYALARALIDGTVELATFRPERIREPASSLARRFRVVEADDIAPTAIEPARVRLRLKDGRLVERGRETVKGSPEEPMSEDEVRAKFRACMRFGLGTDASGLEELVMRLDALADARELVAAFPRRSDPVS